MNVNPDLEPRKADPPSAFIVDDDVAVRAFMARSLERSGFSIREFSRIEDIETALTRSPPDLVALDLSLGETDAVEVMKSLASSRFGGKVLLVSGHDAATIDGVQAIGARYGLSMLPFLRKPFRVGDLASRVSALRKRERIVSGDTSLLAALQNNWLDLWYQPKIDLASMSVCGAEALVRLCHPVRGMLPPSAFLPPAGDPLYRPLSDFVVRRALSDWPLFSKVWSNIRLAVNVPVSVLQSPDFVGGVRRHLPTHPGFPGLIVEITEDEAISEPEIAREAAIQLKLHSIHVSVDDFGSGFSSLARLKELPFVELKLDRSFVNGCASDGGKHSMCRSVAELAHRFNMIAVAEGVETEDDLQVLIETGYDMAQGYYFSKPMSGADFIERLSTAEA